MATQEKRINWIFPHHLGPAIRPFSASLLYHGHLDVSLPGWLAPEVLEWFARVRGLAKQRGSVLDPMLSAVAHVLAVAQDDAIRFVPITDHLGGRIRRLQIVYPGGPADYISSQQLFSKLNHAAQVAFQTEEGRKVAATELVWRIFELALLLSTAEEVLVCLEQRAASLATPWHLLEECYLHRYSIARASAPVTLVTDSEVAVAILASAGVKDALGIDSASEVVEEQLSFKMFEALVADYLVDLSSERNARILASLISDRGAELARFKSEVVKSVRELVDAEPRQRATAYQDVLSKLTSEVATVAQLDESTRTALFHRLTEDKTLWGSIAGFLGTALSTAPSLLTASLAVTGLTSVGTAALKLRREREQQITESPWSFVYYAARGRR